MSAVLALAMSGAGAQPAGPLQAIGSKGSSVDWRQVNTGDAGQPVMSIDLNSLGQEGSVRRIRSLVDYAAPNTDPSGRAYQSELQQLYFNCAAGQIAVERLGHYAGSKGRGTFTDLLDPRNRLAFGPPRPGTPGAIVTSMVCDLDGSTRPAPMTQQSVAPVASQAPARNEVTTASGSSTWQLVNPGDPQWPAYYIEARSVRTAGSYKTVRTLAENKAGVPSTAGRPFKSSLGLVYVDCANRQAGVLAYGIYSGPMATGTFSEESDPAGIPAFSAPGESTPMARIVSQVCAS